MHIVICGGGAIGASAAYFLARQGAAVTLVESTGIGSAASGKSGGFLAREWCDGSPLQALARRSFDLHAELADTLDGDWGHRRLTTFAGFAHAGAGRGGRSAGWLSGSVTLSGRLGGPETTAQVHPGAYTRAMMQAAEGHGATLRRGSVGGATRDGDRVAGIFVDGERLAADAVVLALGPWSALAADWLPLPPVYGLKGHSMVFRTGTKIPAEALFLEYQEEGGALLTPEVFPRPDGTTYVCAVSSESPVPLDPAAVAPDTGALERLGALCADISPVLADSEVLARQACFRPVTRDGLPLIGPLPGVEGAYVATGHSVWGILNAPATGEAIAELVLEGRAATVDIRRFDPARLL